jgi:hypothetical protein
MTREQAIELRRRQLQGAAVDPVLLQRAIEVISQTHAETTVGSVLSIKRRIKAVEKAALRWAADTAGGPRERHPRPEGAGLRVLGRQ